MLTTIIYRIWHENHIWLKVNAYFLLLPVECSTGDETGLEDMGTADLSFRKKVRVTNIQTEKAILFKLAEDRNISECLSIWIGLQKYWVALHLLGRVAHVFPFIKWTFPPVTINGPE